jgi:predicted nucleic acid-binding protein
MSALAHLQLEDSICEEDLEQARQQLIQSWEGFTIVEVTQPLVATAGRFADAFALRGYDSVQLAAAHVLHANAEETVLFACYDRRLNLAAQLLQLEVLPSPPHQLHSEQPHPL